MIKRIIAVLTTVFMAVLFSTSPAFADIRDGETRDINPGPRENYVRSIVQYESQNDGTGWIIRAIELDCWPMSVYENNRQINTIELDLYVRDGGEKKWSQDDGNVTNNCHREWHPDVRVPERGASLFWKGEAELDGMFNYNFSFWNAGPN